MKIKLDQKIKNLGCNSKIKVILTKINQILKKKFLEEKALLNQKKSQEKQEADRQRRIEYVKKYL